MRHAIAGVMLLALVCSLTGCLLLAGAGAATTGVLYVKGAAVKNYPATVEQTYNAGLDVLRADKIVPYKQLVGPTIGNIEATLTDGKTVKMEFKATGVNTTEVTIRIGTFGDKDRSNYFFEKMDQRIK